MLKLENVSFQVDGKYILKNINLNLDDHKIIVITGPNGGGKSTLAKIIMGIEKPSEGKIFFNDLNITDMEIHERAKLGIGYAFQQPPRFKGMSVKSLLTLAHGSDLGDEHCCSYLSDVGLCSKDYLNREVDATLSGGEVKRIEIASLLARDLKWAIFDEPEAGIDLWSFAKLVETFQLLHEKSKMGILIISHQERIMKLADEIIIMNQGIIAKAGCRDQILPELSSEFDASCEFRK
ncbi:MAG: ATP-binding cassette domain-containing protein [Erysipelotrichaceae bacterium]